MADANLERSFTIRDARADERGAIRELTLRAYSIYATIMDSDAWAGLDGAVRRALESETAERIVAEDHGALIGSVMLFPADTASYGEYTGALSAPELRLLAVPVEAQGRGVGRRLVEECIRRARASGAPAIGLHTSRSMATARDLYLRMGFERAPETDFFPPGAEHVEGYRLLLANEPSK
jgi:predicted N-acetyltransferase YhbS